jgi:DNA adenine methylase
MKTFIRRPGNKTKHVKKILPYIPEFEGNYIEPFVGTGALFLTLEPSKWIINDINKELIDIWKIVRDDPEFLLNEISKLKEHLLSVDTKEKIKYCKEITSSIDNEKIVKLKAVKYHLMTYCSFESTLFHSYSDSNYFFTGLYGPLYETNSCHVFTESYIKKINHLNDFFKNGIIMNQDYSKVLKKVKSEDFVFLDPPYFGDKEYKFSYNNDEKIDESFVNNLIKELIKLDKKGVKWMMTQVDSDSVRENFCKYNILEITMNNGVCDKLRNCELLIMNY